MVAASMVSPRTDNAGAELAESHLLPREGPVVVGILGAGQLGRMLGLAAVRMGLQARFLDRAQSGATEGIGETHLGDWSDPEVLRAFVRGCAVVTTENEWAPAAAVEATLAAVGDTACRMFPGSASLDPIADKGAQKQTLAARGIPTAPFELVASQEEAVAAVTKLGGAAMLKRRRGSYDGYGNHSAHSPEDARAGWSKLNGDDGLLVEAWVPFERELSVIVARSCTGEVRTYPVATTEQRDHRCHATQVPSGCASDLEARAMEIGRRVVDAFDLVGVTAIELFLTTGGELLVNEVAPRPHNTGHYTIEGCVTSQFENHLRAVLGLPLGETSLRNPCVVMINVLGQREGEASAHTVLDAAQLPEVAIHLYGKRQVRPKRKMGHVTCLGSDLALVRRTAEEAAEKLRL
ncbi:MAG: 5-(carboxyamino)imidazole ribonucleotide synthase [Nannocystaceae bacterium]